MVKQSHDVSTRPRRQSDARLVPGGAAAILAIGYILAADLCGRSAAAFANINARARVAEIMIRASEGIPADLRRADN